MTKRVVTLLIVLLAVSSCVGDPGSSSFSGDTRLLVNQIGYWPNGPKTALVTESPGGDFTICRADNGETVFTGTLSASRFWDASGEDMATADFSALTEPGNYILRIPGGPDSRIFSLSDNIYNEPYRLVLKSYYFQRAGIPLEAAYAGKWARPAGHLQDSTCTLQSSTGKTGTLNSPGGWYDAGDYGKYMVNGGISVCTLLALDELCPRLTGDALSIPESGNGRSDLLDEVKYELDWMLTMQDSDGGVFFKLAGLNWPAMKAIPSQDTQTRYVIGKSTTSTLNFTASMAMAARIYQKSDARFSAACLTAAEQAWLWAVEHPSVAHPDKTIPGSGPYDDSDYSDEFLWAAAELWITTGLDKYKTWLTDHSGTPSVTGQADWSHVRNLAWFSLLKHNADPGGGKLVQIRAAVLDRADNYLDWIADSPGRIPMDVNSFAWGSFGSVGNKGIILAYAHWLTGDKKYLNGLIEIADYLSGKNATGYTCATGLGENPPMFPHHRPSAGDLNSDPVPGLVVGGPNPGRQDGQSYPHTQPARCYVDVTGSYSSNEPAINQNASVCFVFGYLASWE